MGKFGHVHSPRPFGAAKLCRLAFIATELVFIAITLAALSDLLFDTRFGFGWRAFFVGFIVSAWGAVAIPLCGQCCGWEKEQP